MLICYAKGRLLLPHRNFVKGIIYHIFCFVKGFRQILIFSVGSTHFLAPTLFSVILPCDGHLSIGLKKIPFFVFKRGDTYLALENGAEIIRA